MQLFSKFKFLFVVGLIFLMAACNSNSKYKIELKDIKQEEKYVEPPPPPPPRPEPMKVEVKDAIKKCFANDGLKYKTVITMGIGKTDIIGIVTSEELETGKKESVGFTGTITGKGMIVKFRGTAPVIGDVSEWTDKPWTIENVEGKGQWKEMLHIVFNAKNYDNDKWEDIDYQFVRVDCK